ALTSASGAFRPREIRSRAAWTISSTLPVTFRSGKVSADCRSAAADRRKNISRSRSPACMAASAFASPSSARARSWSGVSTGRVYRLEPDRRQRLVDGRDLGALAPPGGEELLLRGAQRRPIVLLDLE